MAKQINLGNVKAKINNQVVDTITGSNGVTVTTSGNNITLSSPDMVAHINDKNNPHNVTKNQLGLGNVENKSPDDILNEITAADITRALGFNLADKVYPSRVYGFELDCNESNPASAIRYIGANENYQSAYMDFTNDVFNYGDWINAWFIANLKVVLMRFDGTIECELDKNDYTNDIDGNTVDISSANTIGNVMVGIPTVWIKYDITNPMKPKYYFAPVQVDSTYKAWAHVDANGDVVPYKYIGVYECWKDSNDRLRSLSGCDPAVKMVTSQEYRYCLANNISGKNNWQMFALCDHMLIGLLLLLIGKSTDTQEVFGAGNGWGYYGNPGTDTTWPKCGSPVYNGAVKTGCMNQKGLFWGFYDHTTLNNNYRGVKVFGIEHYWGNLWKKMLGLIIRYSNDSTYFGTLWVKMTPSTADGSTIQGYLPTPDIANDSDSQEGESLPNGLNISLVNNYIKYDNFMTYQDGDKYNPSGPGYQCKGTSFGLFPYQYMNEGDGKYIPDLVNYYNNYNGGNFKWIVALRNGGPNNTSRCGAFVLYLSYGAGGSSFDRAVCLTSY